MPVSLYDSSGGGTSLSLSSLSSPDLSSQPTPDTSPEQPEWHPRTAAAVHYSSMSTMSSPSLSYTPSHSHSRSLPDALAQSNNDSDSFVALTAAHRRIAELESQVRLLNQKAAAAVDRWADFEDEIIRLRNEAAERRQADVALGHYNNTLPQQSVENHQRTHASSSLSLSLTSGLAVGPATAASARPSTSSGIPSTIHTPLPSPSRPSFLSSFLSPRRPSAPHRHDTAPELLHIATASPPLTTTSLTAALAHESTLRQAAEAKLASTTQELEDLSAALFEQANEMVADERRANARLLERMERLEKREREKKTRLDLLEVAVGRMAVARKMVGDGRGDRMSVPVSLGMAQGA